METEQDTTAGTRRNSRLPKMAIEFRCIRCGQKLRVPDEDRGKRARCPTCNAIVDIPGHEHAASPILLSRERSDVIDYELFGEESQYVEITLDPGEVTIARSESLLWMSPGIAMESASFDDSIGGGLLEKISQVGRRMLTNNSLRMTAFCNVAEHREVVAFAPDIPARLIPMHLDEFDNRVYCHEASILCAARGIEINDATLNIDAESMPMHLLSGDGIAILQSRGQLFHRELKENRSIAVKTQSIVALTLDVTLSRYESVGVEEQSSVTMVRGPGEIWLQTLL